MRKFSAAFVFPEQPIVKSWIGAILELTDRAGEQLARSQALLLEFLWLDLELAFTFLDTARATRDEGHSRRAIENSRRALEAVRQLSARLEDLTAREEVRSRSNELEDTLLAVQAR
jgi:hypothetical protein